MPPRSSASAKAKLGRPMSSAAKCRSPPRRQNPKAASSCCTPRRCMATRLTAIRWDLSSPNWSSRPASRLAASMSTRGTEVHNHKEKFRVWISGQVRGVTKPIRREMRRRAAVEPVIGHTKAEHRMGRNYLKGRDGDRINAVLAAAGYNFGLLLRWLAGLLRALLQALFTALSDPQPA